MANIDGLPVNSAVTHAEFMARTEDTSTTGAVNFQNTTDSADPTTGAIKTAGGLGVAKSLNVGQNASVGGELIVLGETTLNATLNASDIIAANITADQVDTPVGNITTVNATTVNTDDLNLTNALTVPSLTVNGPTVINGDFTVNGTPTIINSTNVSTVDQNITVNVGGNDASSEGSGFTVDRTGTKGSLQYANALTSKFKIGDLASEAEIATVSHTQTLTNKTLTSPVLTTPSTDIISATEQGSTPATPASGVRKLYPKSDGFYQLDSTGLETKVGSGSGGGGVQNLLTDGDAESGIASYVEGSYSAATRPAGTFTASSGAGSFAISATTTNPINGPTSFLLTKSAGASRQGRAVERTISLDQEYQTKVLQMKIKFRVVSGTFVAGSSTNDSSAIFYIGEFNGSTWKYTEPSSFKALSNSTTIVDYVNGTFQVSSDTTQIKLISYVAETANSAWVLQCEFEITPSVYVYGTPITDWQNYTPTFVALGTVTGIDVRWRRNGQSVEIEGRFTSGTVTASTATISLPAGLVGSPTSAFICGDYGTQGTTTGTAVVYNNAANNLYFGMANWGVAATGTQVATGGFNSFNASVPIQGWSSSVQMSDSADTRILAAKYTLAASTSITSGSPINFSTKVEDTHGAVTTGAAWKFIAPISGLYSVTALQNSNGAHYYRVYKNGVADDYLSGAPAANYMIGGKAQIRLNAGEYIDVRPDASVITQSVTYITIERISGPSAIAANESINLRYTNTAGTSIANTGDVVVPFVTRDFDSHGNWVTDTFTSNCAQKVRISANISFVSALYAAGNRIVASIYKNGSFYSYGYFNGIAAAATIEQGAFVSDTVSLIAGDTLQVRVGNNRTAGATSLTTTAGTNRVTIERIG